MRWRAFYTEGREFSGGTVEQWKALPMTGVIVVVVYRDTGRTVYSGGDWYWLEPDRIGKSPAAPWGSHAPYPADELDDGIKRGDGVSDEEFGRVYRGAHGDHL